MQGADAFLINVFSAGRAAGRGEDNLVIARLQLHLHFTLQPRVAECGMLCAANNNFLLKSKPFFLRNILGSIGTGYI